MGAFWHRLYHLGSVGRDLDNQKLEIKKLISLTPSSLSFWGFWGRFFFFKYANEVTDGGLLLYLCICNILTLHLC